MNKHNCLNKVAKKLISLNLVVCAAEAVPVCGFVQLICCVVHVSVYYDRC